MIPLRPFFPYYGSKWNTARYYPPPLYSRVIEPFAGSAGYSLFYGVPTVTLFDKDPIIVGVWEYLLSATAEQIAALPEMPEIGDNVDNYELPQAAKWLIGFWLNRGSAQPKKSRTAYSARTDKAQLNWGPRAKERIIAQLPAIREWRVGTPNAFNPPNLVATWFIDPPYGRAGTHYRFGSNQIDYGELAAFCHSRVGQVIVCENVGATWLPFTALGSFKSTRGRSEEAVYTFHVDALPKPEVTRLQEALAHALDPTSGEPNQDWD